MREYIGKKVNGGYVRKLSTENSIKLIELKIISCLITLNLA